MSSYIRLFDSSDTKYLKRQTSLDKSIRWVFNTIFYPQYRSGPSFKFTGHE